MRNNNNLLELDELKVTRAREHAEKYLRAHGYEIISREVITELRPHEKNIYVTMVIAKDGKKDFYWRLVR